MDSISNTTPTPTTSRSLIAPFLTLPTELRLKIYTHIIASSLSRGKAHDISALLFTHPTIHTDISSIFLPTLLPLLTAQHLWRSIPNFNLHLSPLRIRLLTPPHLTPEATKLHITIPVREATELSHPNQAFIGLESSARVLAPILTIAWGELRARCVDVTPATGWAPDDLSLYAHQTAITCLFLKLPCAVFERPSVGRVVCEMGNPGSYAGEGVLSGMLGIVNVVRRRRGRNDGGGDVDERKGRAMKRAWIKRVVRGAEEDLGWRLSLDFKEGLGDVKGALWICEDDEKGVLRIKRLGDGQGHIIGQEELEEKYIARIAKEDTEWREAERVV